MEIKYLRYFLAVAREENRTMKFLPGPVIILKDWILKVHSACLITDLFLHRKVSESSCSQCTQKCFAFFRSSAFAEYMDL